jgi:hypothetical protein
VNKATDRKSFVFLPPLSGPDRALYLRGNLFPGVQPLLESMGTKSRQRAMLSRWSPERDTSLSESLAGDNEPAAFVDMFFSFEVSAAERERFGQRPCSGTGAVSSRGVSECSVRSLRVSRSQTPSASRLSLCEETLFPRELFSFSRE